eukprot:3081813-Amphidinium_carterae.1
MRVLVLESSFCIHWLQLSCTGCRAPFVTLRLRWALYTRLNFGWPVVLKDGAVQHESVKGAQTNGNREKVLARKQRGDSPVQPGAAACASEAAWQSPLDGGG